MPWGSISIFGRVTFVQQENEREISLHLFPRPSMLPRIIVNSQLLALVADTTDNFVLYSLHTIKYSQVYFLFMNQDRHKMQSEALEVVTVTEDYLSLRAKEHIPTGAFLTDLWGPLYDKPTCYTIHVTPDKHVEPQGVMKFANHSCSPNARFVFSMQNRSPSLEIEEGHTVFWHLVACRDIKKGEDITFDYTTTEYTMARPFDCLCGADSCLGSVSGFKFLSPDQKRKRLKFLSPVVKELDWQQCYWYIVMKLYHLHFHGKIKF